MNPSTTTQNVWSLQSVRHLSSTAAGSRLVSVAAMVPSEQTLPVRANMDVIRELQTKTAPEIFTPRCVYDGRKNMFSIRELPFTEGTAQVKFVHHLPEPKAERE